MARPTLSEDTAYRLTKALDNLLPQCSLCSMMFTEMRIKTDNCRTVLLADQDTKVFKKAEHLVAVAERNTSGPVAGVRGVAFAVACVCLLGCCCSDVPQKLHYCTETLTLLTLTAPRFSELIDEILSVAA